MVLGSKKMTVPLVFGVCAEVEHWVRGYGANRLKFLCTHINGVRWVVLGWRILKQTKAMYIYMVVGSARKNVCVYKFVKYTANVIL